MNSLRLGFFLAKRSIQHSSKWITAFTILTILLLFLAVMVISGILVGLIQGSEVAFRDKYLGDVVVSKLDKKNKIERAGEIINTLNGIDGVVGVTSRYVYSGSVEANYLTRKSDDIANKKSTTIRGINPTEEDVVTKLSDNMLEGEYLAESDASKYILLGKDLLAKYSVVADVDPTALRDIGPGSKVRLEVANNNTASFSRPSMTFADQNSVTQNTYEYTVKGIVKIKAADLSSSIFMVDSELRKLANKNIADVDEIAIRLEKDVDPARIKNILVANGFDSSAKIQTFNDSLPAFVVNMKALFGALGNAFGLILMIVAVTVLFIVIFINALTKRRQIGILKGIGISRATILWSYIFQALLYSTIGAGLGLLLVFFVIKPFFISHPIDFPFSDGILVAEVGSTFIKVFILVFASFFAGLIPSWMVVRRNTLDAILGRN